MGQNSVAVDDLFAFVIKMPLLHRIACFRDDLIFVIFLYQYWQYDVDHHRKNEFGQGGDGALDDATKRSIKAQKKEKKEDKEEEEKEAEGVEEAIEVRTKEDAVDVKMKELAKAPHLTTVRHRKA